MKGLLIGGATVLSIVFGIWPGGASHAKPTWWRWLAIASIVTLFVLALGIPTAGTFVAGAAVAQSRANALVPIRATIASVGNTAATLTDRAGRTEVVALDGVAATELIAGNEAIIEMSFDDAHEFTAHRVIANNPLLTLPLIPGLEERARNLYFHVPTAWIAQLAWFVALFYAVVYLRHRRPEDDARAVTAAGLGALFCILATTTGAVWAKFNWGTFWNWDPRQTSIFIVLVVYGAYFALRSALDGDDQRARISSVYLALLAVPVVFFMFILPRMTESLHPGSLQDMKAGNAGPVLSASDDALDPIKQVLFALGFFSWSLLFFWMLNVGSRARLAAIAMKRRAIAREASPTPITTTITARPRVEADATY